MKFARRRLSRDFGRVGVLDDVAVEVSHGVPATQRLQHGSITAPGANAIELAFRNPGSTAESSPSGTLRWVCNVRRMDANGRVIDKPLLARLGWTPGTELGWRHHGGAGVIGNVTGPRLRISAAGNLRLPAPLRRTLGIRGRDRVLLAANRARNLLFVLAPTLVERTLDQACATPLEEVMKQ